MKKFTKIAAILLALTLVFGLVACGSQQGGETEAPEATNGDVVIYLTRHGETMFNVLGRNQGWSDTPLTDNGVTVAKALGLALKEENVNIDAFYSGDLGRQRATAKNIMEQVGVPYKELNEIPNLREVCFGSSEGLSSSEIAAIMMEAYDLQDPIEIYTKAGVGALLDKFVEIDLIGNAETVEQATKRMVAGLDEIVADAQANGYDEVLAVSSGMVIALFNAVYGTEKVLDVPNCSITKVVYHEGTYTIEYVADTTLLEKGMELLGN